MSMSEIPEDLIEYYEDVKRRAGTYYSPEMQLIERITKLQAERDALQATLDEAKKGWDSAIADLLEAARICEEVETQRDALLEECEAASRWMREIAEAVDFEIPAEGCGPDGLESLRLAVIGNIEMAKIEIERLMAPMSINEIKIGAVRFNQIISERLAAITKATAT